MDRGWKDGWLAGWRIEGWMDGWMEDGWVDGWMDRWRMEGWMDGQKVQKVVFEMLESERWDFSEKHFQPYSCT